MRKQFKTFNEFASASLDDIYGEKLEKALHHVNANHLESGVWMNRLNEDGSVHFEWKAFPRLAQIAPTYGIQVSDFNSDGTPDVYAVQNSYSTQPETGWWRGGLSQLLYGQGDGSFKCVPANQSGLVVADDGKALALVDLNNDHFPDVVATQNNGDTKVFTYQMTGESKPYVLHLTGESSNPAGVGARMVVHYKNGTTKHFEIQAGAGYLTQQPAVLYLPSENMIQSISVRWPDGNEKDYPITPENQSIELTQ